MAAPVGNLVICTLRRGGLRLLSQWVVRRGGVEYGSVRTELSVLVVLACPRCVFQNCVGAIDGAMECAGEGGPVPCDRSKFADGWCEDEGVRGLGS